MQTFKITSKIFIAVLFLIFGAINCSDTGSNSEPDPDLSELSAKEQKMVGTWKHIRIEGEGLGVGPIDYGTFTWTFNADRTGEYYQNPDDDKERTRDITWRLDGDDIIFSKEEGKGDPIYRVDEYGENQMKWHNYPLAETSFASTYVVERQ